MFFSLFNRFFYYDILPVLSAWVFFELFFCLVPFPDNKIFKILILLLIFSFCFFIFSYFFYKKDYKRAKKLFPESHFNEINVRNFFLWYCLAPYPYEINVRNIFLLHGIFSFVYALALGSIYMYNLKSKSDIIPNIEFSQSSINLSSLKKIHSDTIRLEEIEIVIPSYTWENGRQHVYYQSFRQVFGHSNIWIQFGPASKEKIQYTKNESFIVDAYLEKQILPIPTKERLVGNRNISNVTLWALVDDKAYIDGLKFLGIGFLLFHFIFDLIVYYKLAKQEKLEKAFL